MEIDLRRVLKWVGAAIVVAATGLHAGCECVGDAQCYVGGSCQNFKCHYPQAPTAATPSASPPTTTTPTTPTTNPNQPPIN